ncbi:mismatch-specific DNA-glycosylase [Nocardioides yefusunii]|uniref:Mismatch-specific DNA-glycosylase n=1 Tax=Nocardioides yefusunii TaxID=2500546 RepID=A0ABW1QWJ9_9ACTN|nr:mismatch-specific DNA-glycosylase [Nocardioides yefusunii]
MARFTRDELETYRDAEVPDLLGDDVKLLFVGINPGLWTAATLTHFAHPTNRFYPALHRAGITEHLIDPVDGMTPFDRDYMKARGIGFTNVVRRATARADELSAEEITEGGQQLLATVARVRPRVVAIAGLTVYRQAFGQKKAVAGRQELPEPDLFGGADLAGASDLWSGAELWVVPNPSGLNARETVDSLAQAYAGPARAAGVI